MTFERSPQLNSESVSVYQQQGFLLLPAYFSQDEILAVKSCLPHILSARTERTIFEPDGQTVRSVYGVHKDCELVARLSRHPLLVSAARQLLGGEVYLYQSKLNLKPAFAGTAWDWHQDYTYWHNEDAMPAPRAVNIAVFLDDDEASELRGGAPAGYASALAATEYGPDEQDKKSNEDWLILRSGVLPSATRADRKFDTCAERIRVGECSRSARSSTTRSATRQFARCAGPTAFDAPTATHRTSPGRVTTRRSRSGDGTCVRHAAVVSMT